MAKPPPLPTPHLETPFRARCAVIGNWVFQLAVPKYEKILDVDFLVSVHFVIKPPKAFEDMSSINYFRHPRCRHIEQKYVGIWTNQPLLYRENDQSPGPRMGFENKIDVTSQQWLQ